MATRKLVDIRLLVLLFALISAVTFVTCKDSGVSVGPSSASVSLKADNSGGSSADLIVIDSAKFIIELVEIQTADETSTIKLGPFRIFVDLTNRVTLWGTAEVPPGVYNRVSFKIHKHNPGDPLPDNDQDFLNPVGPVGYSGVIAGTYNSEYFVYKSSKTAHQFVNIDPPLVVPENPSADVAAVVNVTILVMWKDWFVKNGEILDPRLEENWNDIENNIKDSFNKAFRDDDLDGNPDN